MDTRESLERQIRRAAYLKDVAYILRDRAVGDGKELLARSWDMRAIAYDMQRVRLQNELESAN